MNLDWQGHWKNFKLQTRLLLRVLFDSEVNLLVLSAYDKTLSFLQADIDIKSNVCRLNSDKN